MSFLCKFTEDGKNFSYHMKTIDGMQTNDRDDRANETDFMELLKYVAILDRLDHPNQYMKSGQTIEGTKMQVTAPNGPNT